MVDKTKWKSVICKPETQEKVQDLANLYEIPMSHVLRNIVDQVWAKEFMAEKNPFVNQSKKYKNIV
jgi:hypothetical protein|tara:strand:+ start:4452 stop:4649 length:198 start_codon:yes stop_codon:yes gene_type:complete